MTIHRDAIAKLAQQIVANKGTRKKPGVGLPTKTMQTLRMHRGKVTKITTKTGQITVLIPNENTTAVPAWQYKHTTVAVGNIVDVIQVGKRLIILGVISNGS